MIVHYLAATPLPNVPRINLSSRVWFLIVSAIIIFLMIKQSSAAIWHVVEGIILGMLAVGFFPPVATQVVKLTSVGTLGKSGPALPVTIILLGLLLVTVIMLVRERRGRGGG